ncbi:MAG: bifunctional diaminohydroxyphosphoribosylaminopyrimidine deaminase/5-amino-6-(5-phosphoribosylamino)uracil reductase RibD [bacterium]
MDLMLKTIRLAKKGMGHTSPNPLVGAIVVKNNKIISQAYHKKFGGRHAEILALKKAGTLAKGAIMYVNIEPCCHHGKTPPCTQAIVKAGIKQVNIAMLDPNPLVNGKGKKQLEQARIQTNIGQQSNQAKQLNESFHKYITTGLPFITAKWAMSLDGKISTCTGDSKWISCKKSREFTHQLRQRNDAILIGVNTVIQDDPKLTARINTKKLSHPIRIILDSTGRTPLSAKIFQQPGQTIIACTEKIKKSREKQYLQAGAQIIKTKAKNDQINLSELIKKLGKKQISSILIEGGSEILGSAVDNHLIDKAYIFMSPKIIGGRKSKTPVSGHGFAKMSSIKQWKIHKIKKIENDICVIAYA